MTVPGAAHRVPSNPTSLPYILSKSPSNAQHAAAGLLLQCQSVDCSPVVDIRRQELVSKPACAIPNIPGTAFAKSEKPQEAKPNIRRSHSLKGVRMRSWLLVLIGIGFAMGGVSGVGIKVSNPQPTELTCKEYFEKGTSATWVTLKNCNVYYSDFVYAYPVRYSASSISSSKERTWYAPIRTSEADEIKLLFEVRDPETLKLMEKLASFDSQAQSKDGTPELKEFLSSNLDKLEAQSVNLTGMLTGGLDKRRNALSNAKENLAPDFQILEQGAQPDLMLSLLLCGLSAVLILVGSGWKPR